VLPSVATCIAIPAAPGCSVVAPAVQTATASTPLGQALNTTVNIINTVGSTVPEPDGKGEDMKTATSKKEAAKDPLGDGAVAKNEARKKTYCN
jgi:hypothetical protein